MLKNITLGQYYPVDSRVHRLDPRTKLLLTIAFIVAVFLVKHLWGFLIPAAFLAFACAQSRVPAKVFLRGLKPLRFILVLTFLLNLFFSTDGPVLVEFWIIRITQGGLHQAVHFTLRLIFLVLGTSLMTLTTSPVALADAIETLLSPLKKIHFPVHELAMMMTIALRFIPTLLEETDKIMMAQKARGADFESGNLFARAKAMVPLLVPLFISAFRRAGDLAMAMESRCYHGGEGRTRLRVLKYDRHDLYAFLITGLMIALVILEGILF